MSEQQTAAEKAFAPSNHLMELKNKHYLPVAPRVVWFRRDHPIESGWTLATECVEGSFKEGYAVFRCQVIDPEGRIVATGYNAEDKQGFVDFVMKAETGSIGRALAACGYGTMAAMDEGEVVDAPQPRQGKANGTPPARSPGGVAAGEGGVRPANGGQPAVPAPVRDAPGSAVGEAREPYPHCSGCDAPMNANQVRISQHKAQLNACPKCLKGILAGQ